MYHQFFQFRSRKFFFVNLVILCVFIAVTLNFYSGCSKKKPTDFQSYTLTANAGADIYTIAGSYAVLDAGKSRGSINWYKWVQDEKNPAKVFLMPGEKKQIIGLTNDGDYYFYLTVMETVTVADSQMAATSEPDTVCVHVGANDATLFADRALEIAIRFMLKNQINELTQSELLRLDSLRFFDGADRIRNLSGLENCKNLRVLQMGHQRISDLSPIRDLIHLCVLDLTQNHILGDISPLSSLTNLEWLDLDTDQISDISALRYMNQLKYLKLDFNPIEDMTPLQNLVKLEYLFAAQAKVSDLFWVSKLIHLKLLWLSNCGINNIDGLTNLIDLEMLDLGINNIIDISPLTSLSKLKWVFLENNKITNISALQNLENLEYVRIPWNNIQDIEPLVLNEGIGKNDLVGIHDNPLNERSINIYIPELLKRGVIVIWQ